MVEQIKHYVIVAVGFFSAGAGGTLVFMLLKNWLSLDRERRLMRERNIASERADFLPLLKQAVIDCGGSNQPSFTWSQYAARIKHHAGRFSTFLKGRSKTAFDTAWEKCGNTKKEELLNVDHSNFEEDKVEQLKAAQQIIVSRLQAVLDCVERA